MKKLPKSILAGILLLIIFFAEAEKANAITLLQDSFSGTTINTAKWIEYDSASRINQNNGNLALSKRHGFFKRHGFYFFQCVHATPNRSR